MNRQTFHQNHRTRGKSRCLHHHNLYRVMQNSETNGSRCEGTCRMALRGPGCRTTAAFLKTLWAAVNRKRWPVTSPLDLRAREDNSALNGSNVQLILLQG